MTRRGEIILTSGRSFLLSDHLGDIEPGDRQGLFQADTRFLSCFRLTLDGLRPRPLAVIQTAADSALIHAAGPALPGLPAGTLALQRQRRLGSYLIEEIRLTNHGQQPAATVLRLELGADFADALELRDVPAAKRGSFGIPAPTGWHHAFAYRREFFACQTLLHWSHPAWLAVDAAQFAVTLQSGETWRCRALVAIARGEQFGPELPRSPDGRIGEPVHAQTDGAAPARRMWAGWDRDTRSQSHPLPALASVYERALADLHTLRFELPTGETIIGAGVPYFMALFGRDSLLTAYQTLALGPDLAANVLRALARYQGTDDDPATDQEPGKIPHEVREGELALLGDLPHRCYYGSVDATPLFLVLFSEYLRRTGDTALREELWPAAEAALAWIDAYGDRDGDGFVEYQRRTAKGLENQGWKDSHDSVAFADGEAAGGPIALCEVQGYVYDAKRRMADLYEERGDPARATALRAEARALQQRFEAAFWLPEAGTYALALDGAKRPVDAIASNAGHCLWSGIASPVHAARLAERLLADDLFSGWGLRTLSTRMARYDPLSYHNGSVWPHDTVLVAAGLVRYGCTAAARRLLLGLLGAAARFPHQRLPELFGGQPRTPRGRPAPYPGACAPQAWAAGAIVLAADLLRQIDAAGRDSAEAQADACAA